MGEREELSGIFRVTNPSHGKLQKNFSHNLGHSELKEGSEERTKNAAESIAWRWSANNCAFFFWEEAQAMIAAYNCKKSRANFFNSNDLKKRGMGDTGFEPVTSTV